MPFVEVEPGVRLYYEDWGSGPAVVFVHGWPLSHEVFEEQMFWLARHGVRAIALDLRGFGRSDKPWMAYSLELFADDLFTFLTSLELTEVTLTGWSMGSAIALRYMARHSSARVSRLALLSAAAPCLTKRDDFPDGMEPDVFESIINSCIQDRPGFTESFTKQLFAKPIGSTRLAWYTSLALAAAPYALASSMEALKRADMRRELDAILVPTLLLHGLKDAGAPYLLTADILVGRLKGSRLVTFRDAGHGLFWDAHDELNVILFDFSCS